ncbi:MAG: tetratricopeptide repeat protein [Tetrasphaera sp.]
MSDQPGEQTVPTTATRGAVDLTSLGGGASPATGAAQAGAGAPAEAGGDALHVQASDATFNDAVNRSIRVPAVLVVVSTRLPESVVFLGTVVEVARTLGGRLQVVSVDVDSNPGLARALQVQSVPITIGLVQGQVLPMFAGAVPADQLKQVFEEFLGLAVQQSVTGRLNLAAAELESDELPPLHQEAFDAIERGDLPAAAAAYEKALAQNPSDTDAKLGLAQVQLLTRTQDVDPAAARAAAAGDPSDIAAALTVADIDLLGGHIDDAFARLIDLVRNTSGPERERVRTHLIGLFDVVGNHDDRVKKARTALMSALF